MKKIIFIVLILVVSAQSFSHQNIPSPSLTQQDLLKKSRHQKNLAWILPGLGTGIALISLATVTANDFGNAIFNGNSSGLNTKSTLFVIGGVIAASSIPFFILSAKNKRKAFSANAFLKIETAPQMLNRSFAYTSYPVLSLKINLH